MSDSMTRERWLGDATEALRPLFAPYVELPQTIHTSIGFPSKHALARKKQRIGECWSAKASSDGNCHIFISPVLVTPFEVLDVLVHELVHVVTPGAGHKGEFIKISNRIGLTAGKPTSASAGEELKAHLDQLATKLGVLPHPALVPSFDAAKKQTTRMIKALCDCGYNVRLSRKWIDEAGAPFCPTCTTQMSV